MGEVASISEMCLAHFRQPDGTVVVERHIGALIKRTARLTLLAVYTVYRSVSDTVYG